jgi:hypothetical protein
MVAHLSAVLLLILLFTRSVPAIDSATPEGTVYDPIGPFAVFSELIEGAAVIESRCISDTLDKRDRWVGCGTGRLDILNSFFGN